MLIACCVAVVAAAGATSAWALASGSSTNYRTAVAGMGTVEQTLDSTGTLQTVNTAQLSFQVGGQVASVAVSPGDQVTLGQVLATLDTSSLNSAVATAQSAVSTAEQKLATDEASETSGTTNPATASSTSSDHSGQSGAGNPAVASDQATLTADQHKTDVDIAQAQADLSKATTVCTSSTGGSTPGSQTPEGNNAAGFESGPGTQGTGSQGGRPGGSGGSGGGSGTGGKGGSTTTTTTTTTTPSPKPTTPNTACAGALQQALAYEKQVSQDQQAVAGDESALAKALSAASASAGQSGSSGVDPAASSASSSSVVAGPDQIAADQATLDADQVQLSEAQTALDEGQIVAPIAGVVASVGIAADQTVTANSTSDQIVVIGPQSFEASTTVAVTDVSQVNVGEKAYVSLDGQSSQLDGEVTEVGPPPTSSSSNDYPVLVSLPLGLNGLYDGASAGVSIIVGQASHVVTVPTSAVHQIGRFAYVSELRNGRVQEVTVSLGAMGGVLTQVSSGVKAGDAVVLANLSEPLPSSNSTTGRAGFAGVGALTGTGGFERGGLGRTSVTGGG